MYVHDDINVGILVTLVSRDELCLVLFAETDRLQRIHNYFYFLFISGYFFGKLQPISMKIPDFQSQNLATFAGLVDPISKLIKTAGVIDS